MNRSAEQILKDALAGKTLVRRSYGPTKGVQINREIVDLEIQVDVAGSTKLYLYLKHEETGKETMDEMSVFTNEGLEIKETLPKVQDEWSRISDYMDEACIKYMKDHPNSHKLLVTISEKDYKILESIFVMRIRDHRNGLTACITDSVPWGFKLTWDPRLKSPDVIVREEAR